MALVILFSLTTYSTAIAQEDRPYYLVQEGDSLWDIATRFGVTIEELQKANNIADPGQVAVGARLIIPGVSGVSGQLSTTTIPFGETLRSLSRRYGISQEALAQLNHVVSPAELFLQYRKKALTVSDIPI